MVIENLPLFLLQVSCAWEPSCLDPSCWPVLLAACDPLGVPLTPSSFLNSYLVRLWEDDFPPADWTSLSAMAQPCSFYHRLAPQEAEACSFTGCAQGSRAHLNGPKCISIPYLLDSVCLSEEVWLPNGKMDQRISSLPSSTFSLTSIPVSYSMISFNSLESW